MLRARPPRRAARPLGRTASPDFPAIVVDRLRHLGADLQLDERREAERQLDAAGAAACQPGQSGAQACEHTGDYLEDRHIYSPEVDCGNRAGVERRPEHACIRRSATKWSTLLAGLQAWNGRRSPRKIGLRGPVRRYDDLQGVEKADGPVFPTGPAGWFAPRLLECRYVKTAVYRALRRRETVREQQRRA